MNKYRDKIFELLSEDTDINFDTWVLSHLDTLERVAILREVQQVARESLGLIMPQRFATLEDFAEFLDEYEKLTGFFKEEDDKFDREIAEREIKAWKDNEDNHRKFIIDHVLADASDSHQWRERAKELIQWEKEDGYYDPKNWERLQDFSA